jgi:tetratricopeptide (TPR) repeat protein
MRVSARALLTVTAASALLSTPLRAAEPPADVPTIEEMLSAVEGGAPGPAAASAKAGPAAPGTPATAATAPRPAVERPPHDIPTELKALRSRVGHLIKLYQRQRKFYHLADIAQKFGKHKQAVRVISDMIHKRQPNAYKSTVPNARYLASRSHLHHIDGYGERTGYGETMLARSLIALGAEKEAERALGDAVARQQRYPDYAYLHRKFLARTKALVTGYAAAKEKLKELEAALEAAPTAELQWAYVEHCLPLNDRAADHLKWFEALLVMVDRYPQHKSVTSGIALWQLFYAYRDFEMHEKSVEVLDRILEDVPGIHLHVEPWNVHAYNVLWEKAESWSRLGILQEELRDRRALESYRKAVETLDAYRKAYPKKGHNVVGESGTSVVGRRLEALNVAILRFAK